MNPMHNHCSVSHKIAMLKTNFGVEFLRKVILCRPGILGYNPDNMAVRVCYGPWRLVLTTGLTCGLVQHGADTVFARPD
jgi:hypothetical protein